ncbi:metallophosphatase [Anaerocolumna cellulosilytica]|uniref:Metallophosphatase n=1 Tax=Anaerocolumna cellulosilytica TaxID=433286 RepID=A0A6S6R3C4_9FIRM|nr:5'-nucleotidase C-terminal domain-containing protein [Anaerocolumna cellulosilytica]MBB5196756.1 5'-nucleotidase [Anaerocolumna cellulosilytica]BCJ95849.1 metallophosphatase [Anaerocolumna cellulosilytica]
MKRFGKVLSLLLIFCFCFSYVSKVSAEEALFLDKQDLTGYTVILHTNDSHGRAVPDSYNGYMGFTAVSALRAYYEKQGAQVLVMDAGDTLHGLPIATLEKGESIVQFMKLAGYDVMTPGNHDFNYGTTRLLELEDKMDFPLLSANIVKKDTKELLLKDNIIIEKNGVKYGIFGLSTPETAYKTNPNNVTTIEFTDPVEAAKKEVTALKSAGAQIIISLAHLGLDESSEVTSKLVAEKVEGIDLIVDGHSHTTLQDGLMVKDTLIVSTGDYIRNIGVVAIDKSGNMKAALVNSSAFTLTDEAIDKEAADITAAQEKLLSEVVGKTSVYLDGVRENVRTKETNLGNLATDAFRKATGADVAITNGGGIRASIEIGTITKKDLVTVFPFGNFIVTKNITGKALLEALEVGVASYPETLGGFPQVSGITFQIDVTKPAGSRVVKAVINGERVNPEKIYQIATNDFMAAGGDGYTMFNEFATVNEYGSMEEIIIDYIKEVKTINAKDESRITVLEVSKEEEKTVTEEPSKSGESKADGKNNTKTDIKSGSKTDSKAETKETAVSKDKNKTESKSSEEHTIYVVVKGDNLSKISLKFYGTQTKWRDIYELNKENISNPDSIFIGQKLKMSGK